MPTAEFTIWIEEDRQDQVIAALDDLGFEGFWQHDDRLHAYVPSSKVAPPLRSRIRKWLRVHALDVRVEEKIVEDENWNEKWERSLEPIEVGPFIIASSKANIDQLEDRILIRIDPKCSFGTGYHESTRLVLRLMPSLIHGGEKVMDAGTGTGVLSIAAIKLGADRVVSFDHDEWAQENATENFLLNDVARDVIFRSGSLEEVPGTDFNLILANINREVLMELLPEFRRKLQPEGVVVLSGILQSDKPHILEALDEQGFKVLDEETENEWWAVSAKSLMSGT